jgi:hypothetical protein
MRLIFCFIVLVFCNTSLSQDRLKVVENPNSIYENVLDSIVKSMNEQNIEDYSKNFASFTKKDRLNMSLFFLRHEPTVLIFEKHILEETDSKVELAISYQISCDIDQKHYKFSSIVTMRKIGDIWKFSKEKVVSFNYVYQDCSSCSSNQNNDNDEEDGLVCFGGQCNLR